MLDRIVRINTVAARIAGVAPPGFFGVRAGQWPDVYAPLAAKVSFQPTRTGGGVTVENDRNWWVRQIGRVKAGGSADTARAQMSALSEPWRSRKGRRSMLQRFPG